MNIRVLLKSATDWSMDNVWTVILDELKTRNRPMWDQLYEMVRQHSTTSRAGIIGIMQTAGWIKDILPFLPDNLKALGDDVLAQSAGSITNYFLRQPAPRVLTRYSVPEAQQRLRALVPEFQQYLRTFSFSDEQRFPSQDALEIMTRMRAIYALREPERTAEDEQLLDAVCDWVGGLSPRLLKFWQMAVGDAEELYQRMQRDADDHEQVRHRTRDLWENSNMLCRRRLREMMDTPLEDRERQINGAVNVVEQMFQSMADIRLRT